VIYPRYIPRYPAALFVFVVVAILFGSFPFAAIGPGPAKNILGAGVKIDPRIAGNPKVEGQLLTTTVLVTTPDVHMTGLNVLAYWIDGKSVIYPREFLYSSAETTAQTKAQGKAEMAHSQMDAINAANEYIYQNFPGALAHSQLNNGAKTLLAPKDVTITLKETGGPSAGLAFTLALITKTVEPELFKGKNIAVTGTITKKGEVGAIGGIDQKMTGARSVGATLFLVPLSNCRDITRIPAGLRVVPVDTLTQAVGYIKAGKIPASAHC